MAQRSRKQPEATVPVITQAEIEKARKEAFPVQEQRTETRQEAHNQYLAAIERVAAMPSNAPPEDALAAKRDAAQAKAAHNRHRVHELEASAKVDELIAKVNKLERWERLESPVPPLEREVKRLTETVKAREDAAQAARVYRPRQAQQTIVYQVVNEYLPELIEQAEQGSYSLPEFVEGELQAMLMCGDPAHGFTHLKCSRCGHDRFLPFSCKARNVCSSCAGRRMNETVAHLVDYVIPDVPLRHWALTFPPPLRYLLAYDSDLCTEIFNIFVRTVFAWQRRLAKREFGLASVRHAHPGAITAIHRVGSALNLNLHLHSAMLDGVFVQSDPAERPVFRALRGPEKGDILGLAWDICLRTKRHMEKVGKYFDGDPDADELAQDSPLLPACYAASLQQTVALGPRAGQGVLRMGAYVENTDRESVEAEQTLGHGYNLHAGYRVSGKDRKGRERILRYLLRPPIATERLSRSPDGRVIYRLRKPWANGTRSFAFDPLDFVAKLLPLVPPPRVNQIRYHGVFGAHSKLRSQIAPAPVEPKAQRGQLELAFSPALNGSVRRSRPDRMLWADLAARTFEIDVLEYERCGHRPMRVVGVIEAPTVDQLAAVSAASSQQASVQWPRRSRAPPFGQMQFS
ncbi:MAG: hypothetical protein A2289_08775, partial [Deltaproteobacteria bacterium RIFOXYA12_FULL_58_15]